MARRLPMLVALAVAFALPAAARAQQVPQTTDEARALAGKNLPAAEAPKPVPPGTIAQTTDDARALAGRMLPRSSPTPQAIQYVGTTDEARAVAGGLLVVAPAQKEAVASCGKSCNCGNHHG